MQNQAQAFVKNIELAIGVDDKANTSDEAFKAFGIQDATGWIVLNPMFPTLNWKQFFLYFVTFVVTILQRDVFFQCDFTCRVNRPKLNV